MRAEQMHMPACCGVQVIGNFDRYDGQTLSGSRSSGTGYYISTFNQSQEEAYKEMCKVFRLVYQTPPKRNRNSGNQLFIAIFERKKRCA